MPKTAPPSPTSPRACPTATRRVLNCWGLVSANPASVTASYTRESSKEALAKLDIIDDPQIELTLLRCCMGFPRFAFAVRSPPPGLVSEAIAFFDQIMDETAEDRFDIAFSDRRKRQWHMPIRMGGVGIPRAEDAAAPAYLANTFDCCDLVREMLGKEDIVPSSNPGVAETDDFRKNHPDRDDLTSEA